MVTKNEAGIVIICLGIYMEGPFKVNSVKCCVPCGDERQLEKATLTAGRILHTPSEAQDVPTARPGSLFMVCTISMPCGEMGGSSGLEGTERAWGSPGPKGGTCMARCFKESAVFEEMLLLILSHKLT